jgi:hypothetical protein
VRAASGSRFGLRNRQETLQTWGNNSALYPMASIPFLSRNGIGDEFSSKSLEIKGFRLAALRNTGTLNSSSYASGRRHLDFYAVDEYLDHWDQLRAEEFDGSYFQFQVKRCSRQVALAGVGIPIDP